MCMTALIRECAGPTCVYALFGAETNLAGELRPTGVGANAAMSGEGNYQRVWYEYMYNPMVARPLYSEPSAIMKCRLLSSSSAAHSFRLTGRSHRV